MIAEDLKGYLSHLKKRATDTAKQRADDFKNRKRKDKENKGEPLHEEELNREVLLYKYGEEIRAYEQLLQDEAFYKVFAGLIPKPILNANIKSKDINREIETLSNLKIISVNKWASSFKNNRIGVFIVDETAVPTEIIDNKEKAKFHELLAKVVFEIAGRENTINEKLTEYFRKKENVLNFFVCRLSFSDELRKNLFNFSLSLKPLNLSSKECCYLEIKINKTFLENISNCNNSIWIDCPLAQHIQCDRHFFKCLQNLYCYLNPTFPQDLVRFIRRPFFWGRMQAWQRVFLREILSSESRGSFLQAFRELYERQAKENRSMRHFGLEERYPSDAVVDYEALFQFISLIQAVYFHNWWAKDILIIGYLPRDEENSERCMTVALLYDDKKRDLGLSLISRMSEHLREFEETSFQDIKDLRHFVRDLKELEIDKEKIEYQISTLISDDKPALVGLANLFTIAGELCSETHEGISLKYAFLFASGTAWIHFEETLSEEDQKPTGEFREFQDPGELRKILLSHYSIFQYPKVVIFIDRNHYPLGLGVTRIVRLKDQKYPPCVTEFQLFREITEIDKNNRKAPSERMYIVYAGQGRVRLYFDGREQLTWVLFRREHHKTPDEELENSIKSVFKGVKRK